MWISLTKKDYAHVIIQKIRNSSRKYTFKSEDGDIIQVCSKNLGTLGYANAHVISWVFNNLEEKAVKDRRGCHEPVHKMPREEVDAVIRHIESFHPAISHYRRGHAHLRRYLPPGGRFWPTEGYKYDQNANNLEQILQILCQKKLCVVKNWLSTELNTFLYLRSASWTKINFLPARYEHF